MAETPTQHPQPDPPPASTIAVENKPLCVWAQLALDATHVCRFDVEDLPIVQAYRWFAFQPTHAKSFYAAARISVPGENRQLTVYMHRVIVGAKPGEEVDHDNGDGLDNRRFNIRRCTRQQNQHNKVRLNRSNTSGWKGVHRQGGKWIAVIVVNGRKVYLGSFATVEAAGSCYDEAAQIHFGEFAAPNSKMQKAGVL